MQKVNIKLKEKKVSKNWLASFLKFELMENFEFKTGQFVMITVPADMWEVKRAYSIASTNKEAKEKREICFYIKKASESWASKFLTQDIKEWDILEAKWPVWHFVDNKEINKYLLISTGCGVWPLIWHYKETLEENNFEKMVNIFSDKTEDEKVEIIDEVFKENNEKVKNILLLSREEKNIMWYRKWRVQSWLEEALEFLWDKNIKVLICGMPEMVDSITEELIEKWIEKSNILSEKY